MVVILVPDGVTSTSQICIRYLILEELGIECLGAITHIKLTAGYGKASKCVWY